MDAQHSTSDLEAIRTHLADACEVMATLIERHEIPDITPRHPDDYFEILVDTIIGQQLSVKAANTIIDRFRGAVGGYDTTAISSLTVDELRPLGLSKSKAAYIISAAGAFESGAVNPQALATLDNQTVLETLTSLRGIGPWTAEMFLIFGLGRPDVWSPGDLGLRNAVTALFGPEADPNTTALRWQPYRSYAALYLWEHHDNALKRQLSQPKRP